MYWPAQIKTISRDQHY